VLSFLDSVPRKQTDTKEVHMSRSASAAAVLALACVTVTATAAAQRQSLSRLGVGLGLTAPRGEFRADANGDGFTTGWQGIVFLELKVPRSPLGLRVDGTFGENPANDQLKANSAPATTKMRVFGGNVDLILRLGGSSRGGGGYVLGGVGSYRVTLSTSSGGVTVDKPESKFAWNAGAGLTYPFGGAAMFLELRYIDVATAFNVGRLPFVALTAGFRLGRR
jgi:outer membrane protein with beta-barrel domain